MERERGRVASRHADGVCIRIRSLIRTGCEDFSLLFCHDLPIFWLTLLLSTFLFASKTSIRTCEENGTPSAHERTDHRPHRHVGARRWRRRSVADCGGLGACARRRDGSYRSLAQGRSAGRQNRRVWSLPLPAPEEREETEITQQAGGSKNASVRIPHREALFGATQRPCAGIFHRT